MVVVVGVEPVDQRDCVGHVVVVVVVAAASFPTICVRDDRWR